jgi:Tol biopolymer transport system component
MSSSRCTLLALAAAIAAPAVAQTTELVSQSTSGVQADNWASDGEVSGDGRYVVFWSHSEVLVPDDSNGDADVFLRDTVAGVTERISVAPDGSQVTGDSHSPVVSADGRYVAFSSDSDGIVPHVGGQVRQVFVRDRLLGVTSLVSVSPTGEQGNNYSALHWRGIAISADGRHVAFESKASNLVAGTSGTQIYVRDLVAGLTFCASRSSTGVPGNGQSGVPALSADGRHVAFESQASNLVPGDTNKTLGLTGADVFVRDLELLTTVRVSVSSAGVEANADSHAPSISADGQLVAFHSWAFTLAPQDAFGDDVFVHDLAAGTTQRITNGPGGWFANNNSQSPSISADGRWVAYDSIASNLVPDDTNGDQDVFLHDRGTGLTTRVSVTDAGDQVESHSRLPRISADGRRLVFNSWANDWVSGPLTETLHLFLRDAGPWTNEGAALAGITGLPGLAGTGSLEAGSSGNLVLTDAAPTAPALLFVSLGSTPAPFKGGTLKALPALLVLPLGTDAAGELALPFVWPAGIPPATQIWFQYAIQDAAAVSGVSLSNAVSGVTP